MAMTHTADETATAAMAGTDDVVGFSFTWEGFVYTGDHREWRVEKISPNPSGTGIDRTTTVVLAPPPSVRFPGGFYGVR